MLLTKHIQYPVPRYLETMKFIVSYYPELTFLRDQHNRHAAHEADFIHHTESRAFKIDLSAPPAGQCDERTAVI